MTTVLPCYCAPENKKARRSFDSSGLGACDLAVCREVFFSTRGFPLGCFLRTSNLLHEY